MRRNARNALATAVIVTLVVALGGAVIGGTSLSKRYWGYYTSPPQVDSRVAAARSIIGMGSFTYAPGDTNHPPLQSAHYTPKLVAPSEYPIQYTLYQMQKAGVHLVNKGEPPIPQIAMTELLKSPELRVSSVKNYDPYNWFQTHWTEFVGRDGKRYLYIIAGGGAVSNDHHPCWRALYELDKGAKPKLISHQIIYYDVAGLERASWNRVALAISPVTTIVGLIMGTLGYRSIRRREPTI